MTLDLKMKRPEIARATKHHVMKAKLITRISTTAFLLVLWITEGTIPMALEWLLLLILSKATLKKDFDD
jgi:hypothetical protein